jgi:Rrf2 family transcriptional regulator, iron-sulfur cluster assembly transcription factor
VKLTTRARYAVMAMVDLSASSRGAPVTLASIAGRQEISQSYLEQIFARLRRAGLVCSVRGPGGGYLLGREADAISINDVIGAVTRPIRATRCGDRAESGCLQDRRRCMTHDLWAALGGQINRFLSSVTLADIVEGRLSERPRPCAMGMPELAREPAERMPEPLAAAAPERV